MNIEDLLSENDENIAPQSVEEQHATLDVVFDSVLVMDGDEDAVTRLLSGKSINPEWAITTAVAMLWKALNVIGEQEGGSLPEVVEAIRGIEHHYIDAKAAKNVGDA